MGMSGSTYNARADEITYAGWVALGGHNNSNLYKVTRQNGKHTYTTYHYRPYSN